MHGTNKIRKQIIYGKEIKMKVLFVVKNLRLSNGVSSFIMNYYRELIKKKDMSFDFLIVSDVGSPYYDEIRKNGGNIFIMPSLKHPIKLINYLKNLFKNNKYDVLHSNVFNSCFPIAYYAKKYGVKVRILHSHATSNGDSLIKRIRNYPFQLLGLKYSNYYFACSKLAGEKIFKKKNFFVVNNAIDLSKFKYSEKTRIKIRKDNNIHEDTIVIGMVGRITIQKNPYFILKIVEELKKQNKNFILWWFGTGDMDKEIINYAKRMKLDDKIIFWGSQNNIQNYYNAMDCFILPSFYEGLPVVGIEAQSMGLKCYFSNKITNEVSLNKYTEFLSIDDSNLWADRIKECTSIERNEILKNSKLSNYSIESLSKVLYNEYKKCVESVNI